MSDMRVREHHGFGHGLSPGRDSDMNCPSCQDDKREGRTPVITGEDASRMAVPCGPSVSFTDGHMTPRQKAQALVDFALADDHEEALAMLIDMGECDQTAADEVRRQLERELTDSDLESARRQALEEGEPWVNATLTEEVVNATWLVATSGPVCAYWTEEDAPMCGHSSCYTITEENSDGHTDGGYVDDYAEFA